MQTTSKRPRGRPPVGPATVVRLPADLRDRATRVAAERGQTRAEFLRDVIARALDHDQHQAA